MLSGEATIAYFSSSHLKQKNQFAILTGKFENLHWAAVNYFKTLTKKEQQVVYFYQARYSWFSRQKQPDYSSSVTKAS